LTRIGLLYPYSGTNLGDGTIFTATIEGLRRRAPGVEIVGITLDPPDTTSRHHIAAFPITGLAIPSYSESLSLEPVEASSGDAGSAEPDRTGPANGLRGIVKAIPLLGPLLRHGARRWRALRRWPREMRELRESFRTVRTLDLVVVSGGGQLDEEYGGPWGHPYSLFRWAILCRLAGTPFAFASVGTQYMSHPLTRFFFRTALASAAYRSYRDPGSKQQVGRWKLTRNDPVVPDLAFSLPLAVSPNGRHPAREGIVVGLSPMVYGHPEHWPTKRPEVYEGYSRRLATFAAWLLERGHRLLIFRSSGADRIAVADFKTRLLGLAGADAHRRVVETDISTVQDFFREVAAADLVVASRLHGVLMSHMLGKPVLAISFDRKVDAQMESMDQSRYRVDISRFEVPDLIERFTALERNAEAERTTITSRVARSRAELDAQYDTLLGLARAARTPSRSRGTP
jgi:polysaccharide pyruvyl transferase WcaK-like protein